MWKFSLHEIQDTYIWALGETPVYEDLLLIEYIIIIITDN